MAQFQIQKKAASWHHSPLFIVVLFVICIVFFFNIIGLIRKQHETAMAKEDARKSLEALQDREESLQSDVSDLKSERGMEAKIREHFPVVKDGEGLVVIVEDPATQQAAVGAQKSNFFKRLFFSAKASTQK